MRSAIAATTVTELDFMIKIYDKYYGTRTRGAGTGISAATTIGAIIDINNVEDNQQSTPSITLTVHGVILSDIYNKPCIVYQNINGGSWITLFNGVITTPIAFNEETNNLTFDIRVRDLDGKIGHCIIDSEIIEYQDVLNQPFPIVFGSVYNYTPLQYNDGLGVTTKVAITPIDPPVTVGLDNGIALGEVNDVVQLSIAGVCVTGTLDADYNLTLGTLNAPFYTVTVTRVGNQLQYASIDKTFQNRWLLVGSTWVFCYKETKDSFNTLLYINSIEWPVGEDTVTVYGYPDSTYTQGLWFTSIPEGADVLLLENGVPTIANSIKYILGIGHVDVYSVKAERTYMNITTKQEIPASYYTIATETIDTVSCTTLTLNQTLSSHEENWSDTVLLDVTGNSGEIVAVLTHLLDTYTTYTIATPTATSIYCNFVLQSNEATLQACRGLAEEVGIQLYVRDDTVEFFFTYLEPVITGLPVLDLSMIKDLSYNWSLSDEENLVTKYKINWYNDIRQKSRISVQVHNDILYGVKDGDSTVDILTDAEIIDALALWKVKRSGTLWKTISFQGFIETSNLESYDYVVVPAIEDVCESDTIGLVQSVALDLASGLTNITIWLPVPINGLVLTSEAFTTLANSARTLTDKKRDYVVPLEPLESQKNQPTYQQIANTFPAKVTAIPNTGSDLTCDMTYSYTAWAGDTPYSQYQIVSYAGNYYLCTTNHISAPGSPPIGGYWRSVTVSSTVTARVYGGTDIIFAVPSLTIDADINCYAEITDNAVIFHPDFDYYILQQYEVDNKIPLLVTDAVVSGTTLNVEYDGIPDPWSNTLFYYKYQIVENANIIYICIKPHWSTDPLAVTTNVTYWCELPSTMDCIVYDGELQNALPKMEQNDPIFGYWNDATNTLSAVPIFYTGSTTPAPTATYEYVQILATISYDPDVSTYLVKLTTETTWVSGPDYAFGAEVIGSDGHVYECILAAGSGTSDPVESPTKWFELHGILPVRIWGYPDADFRDFVPWLVVDRIYPVMIYDDIYYFMNQFTYVGPVGARTISWNIADGRMMACVSDTVP